MSPPDAEFGKINPKLTATLASDYQAIRQNLDQARAIAADYQRQLAGKSNDFAQLRMVLDRANHDLAELHSAIAELRAERHQLANQAQKLYDAEDQIKRLREERKGAAAEKESLRRALACAERTARELAARIPAPQAADFRCGEPQKSPAKEPPPKADRDCSREIIGVRRASA